MFIAFPLSDAVGIVVVCVCVCVGVLWELVTRKRLEMKD